MKPFGESQNVKKREPVVKKKDFLTKEQLIREAFKLHSRGNTSEAERYYQIFLEKGFTDPRVFCNYGAICRQNGQEEKAISLYKKAIEQYPNFSDTYLNLGLILKSKGKLDEAEVSTRKAIELSPNNVNAHLSLGIILRNQGELQAAEASIRKAIELNPGHANAHLNLGCILGDAGQLRDAEVSTRKAIELNPNHADAYYNMGNILRGQGKLQAAKVSTCKAIELNPNHADTHLSLGNILREIGNLEEAKVSTHKAIELNPGQADYHSNLGGILRDIGQLKDAEISIRKAIELNPNLADAHSNLGGILRDIGDLKEAEVSTRKSLELKPNFAEAHYNLSLILLQLGDYKSGWEEYEWRFKQNNPTLLSAHSKCSRWDGTTTELDSQLLLISEQGLGDTLQFMRYAIALRNQGIAVSLCAQPKLHSLIKSSGIDSSPLTPKQANEFSKGQWSPLLSVPRYLDVSPDNPVITEPYISTAKELVTKWQNILAAEQRPIVGINWKGNRSDNKKKGRNIDLEKFAALTKDGNITLLSLQRGATSEEIDSCSFSAYFAKEQSKIHEISSSDLDADFLEYAAIIANCDLILTTATTLAHLAGGIGKRTWTLIPSSPEWRWGLEGDTSFWYPTMRLFRQKERGDWDEVLQRVAGAINKEFPSQHPQAQGRKGNNH